MTAKRRNSSVSCPFTNSILYSGAALEPNVKFRSYMEDATVIIDPFMQADDESDQWGFYAVYDGHGGRLVVDFVESYFHEVLLQELAPLRRGSNACGTSVANLDARITLALQKAFRDVDEQTKSL